MYYSLIEESTLSVKIVLLAFIYYQDLNLAKVKDNDLQEAV